MASRVTSARVVGRGPELSELEAAFSDAVARRPSLAFVAGESGVGKSRLLAEAQRRMEAAGARILQGDCVDLGEGELPYAPLVAALRPVARGDEKALAALGPDLREELRAFLPGLAGPATETSQGRLFEALLALIDGLAAEQPLVLVIEDLHWADRSTRAFLAFLARSICDQRLLLLLSYRPDELHRRHPLRPLLAELEREPRARRVELAVFTREELAEQMEDILGAPPAEELVRRLWDRSEGNALFTEELLAAGLDGRGALPPTLRDALMVRVERLGPAAQEVVRLLGAGLRLSHDVLADAAELEPRALRDALREAVADHILVVDADGLYAFRHALLREVVLDDLLPGERAHLHLALALALERHAAVAGPEGPGAHLSAGIAHHFLAAGDRSAALVAAVRAAAAAERIHARGEAAELLERALELWPRVEDAAALTQTDEAALLLRAARAHDTHEEPGRIVALVERGLGLIDAEAQPERAADLLHRRGQAEWSHNRQEAALATARQALDLVHAAGPTAARATMLGWWATRLMLMGRYRQAVDVAGDALAEAAAVGDAPAESRARNALGVSLMGLGEHDEGIAALREALATAEQAEAPDELGAAHVNLADTLHLAGRSAEAVRVAEAGLQALGRRAQNSWLRIGLAEILLDTGELEAAEALLPFTGRRPVGNTQLFHALVGALAALHRGEHATVAMRLDAARPLVEATVESQFTGFYGAVRAELALREGDLETARAAVAGALELIVTCTDDASRVARVAAVGVLVEAAAAQRARDVGDGAAARGAVAHAELLAAYVDGAAGTPLEDAQALQAAAALARARGADDPRAWERAATGWAALGRPLTSAADALRAAEGHVALGDREGAERCLAAVVAAAEERGAHWLAGEARGLAARARIVLGEAPEATPVNAVADPFGLTPREQQVLALVAVGATNREIGAELFIAEKTASVHVSRILAKLDVRSRTQAAAVAHRFGPAATAS